jgi:hypothetical protein
MKDNLRDGICGVVNVDVQGLIEDKIGDCVIFNDYYVQTVFDRVFNDHYHRSLDSFFNDSVSQAVGRSMLISLERA